MVGSKIGNGCNGKLRTAHEGSRDRGEWDVDGAMGARPFVKAAISYSESNRDSKRLRIYSISTLDARRLKTVNYGVARLPRITSVRVDVGAWLQIRAILAELNQECSSCNSAHN